jgi:hypothetical protein
MGFVYLRPNPSSISNTGIILYALAERVVSRRFLSSMIYGEPQERNLPVRIVTLGCQYKTSDRAAWKNQALLFTLHTLPTLADS